MAGRNRWIATLVVASAGLACITPTPTDTVVVSLYKSFVAGDCEAVRAAFSETNFSGSGAKRKPLFELMEGYCVELAGDMAAAKAHYRSVIDTAPRTHQAFEAALRLQSMARFEKLGISRAEYHRQLQASAKTPPYQHKVEPIHRIEARFPSVLQAAAVEGRVLVDFGIAPDGTVVEPFVITSEPPFVFDGAALATVRHWIYEPSSDGKSKRARVAVAFKFRE